MQPVMLLAPSGAIRQERRFQLISQNLSNVQTVGYKKDVPVFSTLFLDAIHHFQDESQNTSVTSFQQGNIERTGHHLDLAIEGEGFFKVKTPQGVRYTRAGNFKMDKDQRLIHAEGFPILGRRGEIRLNGNEVVVEKDGTIKVDGSESGRIALVTFPDLSCLRKEGNGLFVSDRPDEEREIEGGTMLQGYLEQSNVNPIEEMVKLIDSLRSYESCMKVIQARDELTGRAVNEMGRV